MSKQLSFSATASVLAMAMFALVSVLGPAPASASFPDAPKFVPLASVTAD